MKALNKVQKMTDVSGKSKLSKASHRSEVVLDEETPVDEHAAPTLIKTDPSHFLGQRFVSQTVQMKKIFAQFLKLQ